MKKNEDGFTLIEVLIAIVILSFITIAIVSITNNSQETKDRVVTEDRINLQLETALAILEWDISQNYTPLYFERELNQNQFLTGDEKLDDRNTQRFQAIRDTYGSQNKRFPTVASSLLPIPKIDREDKDELILFTTSNRRKLTNIKQSHFAWIRYKLGKDPIQSKNDQREYTGEALLRYQLLENPFYSEEIDWEKVKPQVLLRNMKSLTFLFWDPNKKDFTDNLDLLNQKSLIIRGIKVELEWVNADGVTQKVQKIIRPLFPEFKPEDLTKYLQSGAQKDSEQESGDDVFEGDDE